MMDHIERRLSDALAQEAATINPAVSRDPDSWNRSPARRRTNPVTWLAAAAAVAALAVGLTFAIHNAVAPTASAPSPNSGTERSTTAPRSSDSPSADSRCAGGWTALPAAIIQKGTILPAGSKAILRFAGGAPPEAALCALAVNGTQTTADGATTSDGSPLGYLSSMSGDESFIVGAFASPVSSVTFSDASSGWTLTINSSTSALTDLGNGWHGYMVLAPARPAVVDVTAKAADGRKLDNRHISFGPVDQQTQQVPTTVPSG